MSVSTINRARMHAARQLFMQCCTATRWVEAMVAARPFVDAESLRDSADQTWQALGEVDFLEAFDGHPKIGDVNSLKEKYRDTKVLASNEQSSVALATDRVIEALAKGNQQYQDKFGFIFIVCASGKTAVEMLELLEQRLPNDRATELANAAREQQKIFQLRLQKLLEESE